MIEVLQCEEGEKSDGRAGAGETDSKTTSDILFSLMGCQMGKKKSIKTSSEDLLSVCIPTERACGRGNHTDEKTVP